MSGVIIRNFTGATSPNYHNGLPYDIDGALLVSQGMVLGQSHTPIPRSSDNATDTVEQTLATITIPAGTMGLHSTIKVVCRWSFTGSTNTKNMSVYFGGVVVSGIAINTAANVSGKFLVEIENMGSLASQETFNGSSYAVSNSAAVTGAIDTANAVALDIRCKWTANVLSESIILKSYSVIHCPGS